MIVHAVLAAALALGPAARDANAKAGEAAFAAERWDEASAAFDAAYRNTGDAAFLYARAQAERRAGRCKVAIVLYEQFIAGAPPPEGERAAQQYIAECRAQLPAEPPPQPVVVEPTPAEPPPPRPAPERSWSRDPLAAALMASGGAGMVAGVVLVPLAYRSAGNADDADDDRAYGDRFAKARKLEVAGAIALSLGTALVVGAIVRWAVLARGQRRSAAAVARAR